MVWRAVVIMFGVSLGCRPVSASELAVTKPASILPESDRGSTLSFNAEFRSLIANPNGSNGWKTQFFNGDRVLSNNNEAQFYSDASLGSNPFDLHDGLLDIVASRNTSGAELPFRSGLLTTQKIFFQRFGYFEMRAKLPSGRGLWPAFWLLPINGAWPPEIDVVETLGHEPGIIYDSVHWQDGMHRSNTLKINTADTSAAFHVYGMSWHPDFVRWFFDGREVARAATPKGMNQPMYLLVNLAVGGQGSWPGAPDAQTVFPAHMLVDWIRAYRYSGGP